MANLRIATISYDHVQLEYANGKAKALTLGEQVDLHIRETIAKGKLVQEVCLFFETMEEQHKLAEAYRPASPKAA